APAAPSSPRPRGRPARAPSGGVRLLPTAGRSRCWSAVTPRRLMRCAHAFAPSRRRAETRLDIVRLEVADRRLKHKSKYTLDRGIPGAFEGETITRRRFMTGGANAAGAVATAAFALPALGFAIGPIFKSTPVHWEAVGAESLFTEFNYVPVVLTLNPTIGEAGKTTVYVRKFNAAIDNDPYDKGTPYI